MFTIFTQHMGHTVYTAEQSVTFNIIYSSFKFYHAFQQLVGR